MSVEGPPLPLLLRRLAECPAEFLAEPRVGGGGTVHVDAVVADLLRELGGEFSHIAGLAPAAGAVGPPARNLLRLVLVASWLLHDDWFRARGGLARGAREFLETGLAETAETVPAERFVADPDRREELARRALAALGLRPDGETAAQAADRLATLDSVERRRVVAASRTAEARARAVREAMKKKAAEEAAARVTRE